MTSTITGLTLPIGDELGKMADELHETEAELEDERRALGRLSGMEGLARRLGGSCADVARQCGKLRQMARALGQTARDFASCEDRICDGAAQGVAAYARRAAEHDKPPGLSGVSGL